MDSAVSRRHGPDAGMATLGGALRGRDNAFGFVRLVLASLVIVDHAFPLGGYGEDPMWGWTKSQESFGGLAVGGFFVASGFLITKSAMSSDAIQFLWRRCLRIFPAFWAVLLVSVFLVSPLFYVRDHGNLNGYWTPDLPGPWTYLTRNWTLDIGQYGLLDVFGQTPYARQVGWSVLNGSLWTLAYEWKCYIIVGALALFGVLRLGKVVVPALAAGLTVLAAAATSSPQFGSSLAPWLGDPHFVQLGALFLWGSVVAVYADRVPSTGRLALLACLVLIISLFVKGGYHLVGYPALAYLVLWVAGNAPVRLRRINARNDYSYGIYVYGFLVQMALADLGVHRLGLVPYICVSWLVTFGCAYLSWHLVEKRALRLKDRGPGRGLGYWLARLRRTGPSVPVDGSPDVEVSDARERVASHG
ncbi:acyltransferase family protein [Oryzihumus leptocrescens]|uniref:Peptidoglycan/LPS O-acetylase OafA/YrhL n=1 Tax=Oryzihumus leptocrescens TaxID=297536 RepID=A0A542ZIJ3_9MICO|nr:acyltransferase [Oryzihumus leptocrescens]TQL59980.1 peptidoglycan/LPS O-acetylase OafA/YrhL [Oryzihumus leptocrescens]